eukprot:133388-Pyramimonas_sp.AAC.1
MPPSPCHLSRFAVERVLPVNCQLLNAADRGVLEKFFQLIPSPTRRTVVPKTGGTEAPGGSLSFT